MDLNARVDVNCGRKDGQTDGRTENRMPISHLAKAGATKIMLLNTVKKAMKDPVKIFFGQSKIHVRL